MTRMPRRKLVGVLGGMGPLATADFLAKLVEETPAACDQEHVPAIVHSVPQIPDRSASLLAGDDAPWQPLLAGLRFLNLAGVELIVMPCNSAHAWHERLQRATSVPLLHIADAAADAAAASLASGARVAILATRGVAAQGMYVRRLAERGLLPVELTLGEQAEIDAIIAAVKGNRLAEASQRAGRLGHRLAFRSDALLLACTELPVVFRRSDLPLIDATRALARAAVEASLAADMAATPEG